MHYELVAQAIYAKHSELKDPFSDKYFRYIVAGLISFDMSRQMGKGIAQKYDPLEKGFASRLHFKLKEVREFVAPLVYTSIDSIDFSKHASTIRSAYEIFAATGIGALHSDSSKSFHVGATKILHWLVPGLFIILDRNVARIFQHEYQIGYRNSTQPVYSASKYIECLKKSQSEIQYFGTRNLRFADGIDTPLTRLLDKVAFIRGNEEAAYRS